MKVYPPWACVCMAGSSAGDLPRQKCSRGYIPPHMCVTVVRQTRRAGDAPQRSPAASLSKFTKPNAAMPTHADSTHPTIQPLRYTTPPGLFGVYMRSSALAYFRQHGASDYHQTATRVSTSRTFYQQIPTVVYGRSGATTRPLSHNGPHTYT